MADPAAIEAPPTSAPAQPPAASPAPVTEAPREHGDMRSAIEAIGREEGSPEPSPSEGRVRGADGKFLPKPAEKPAAKPAERSEATKGDDDVDVSKLPTRDVVKRYHALRNEKSEWLKERDSLKKLSEAPKDWPEKKTYEEKLSEREKFLAERDKRIADYENELRFTNYERSQEYKETYQKPFENAWLAGRAKAAALKIKEVKNDLDAVTQAGRQGTPEDFDALMKIQDDDVAAERAAELYGEAKASVILHHREIVQALNAKASSAIKEYREKGAELEKQKTEHATKWQKESAAMVERFRNDDIEKYPQLFKPDPADPKGNQLLEVGQHFMERVLKNGAPLADGEKQWTHEELAHKAAIVRNSAMAFRRVSYKLEAVSKENKELKTKLADYEATVPGGGNGNGRTAPAGEKSMRDKIGELGR